MWYIESGKTDIGLISESWAQQTVFGSTKQGEENIVKFVIEKIGKKIIETQLKEKTFRKNIFRKFPKVMISIKKKWYS